MNELFLLPKIFVSYLVYFTLLFAVQSEADSFSETEEKLIFENIISKHSKNFDTYSGFESTRSVKSKEYDPSSNQLLANYTAKVFRKDFYYKKAEIEVLEYLKEGKPIDKSEFPNKELEPIYPIFDKNGLNRYNLKILGVKNIKNIPCYEIKVDPKSKSQKYFKGIIYIDKKNLNLKSIQGTFAEFPTGLKEFYMEFYFKELDNVSVMEYGVVKMRAYVPLLKPDRRVISEISISNQKLMKK